MRGAWLLIAVVAGAGAVACEKKEDAPAPAPSAAPSAAPAAVNVPTEEEFEAEAEKEIDETNLREELAKLEKELS